LQVNSTYVAECLARVAGEHGLNHLSPEERYQQLTNTALHEIAGIDRQLIRNISAKVDEAAWRLHTSDAHSVAMRVRNHEVDVCCMQASNRMQKSIIAVFLGEDVLCDALTL
jgi:hypothetical protein